MIKENSMNRLIHISLEHGLIADENAKRRRAETERQLEAEIRWCREQLDHKLSDRHRATIEHQIRHKELTITFLDYSEKK